MDSLKKYLKYILLIVGAYVLTNVLIFIGFNVNYSKIELNGEVPTQITIEKAEATNSDGRIYGYISNNRENDVNGKYIKVSIYDDNNEVLTTEYLKVTEVDYNSKKLFKIKFTVDEANSYSIDLVDSENN